MEFQEKQVQLSPAKTQLNTIIILIINNINTILKKLRFYSSFQSMVFFSARTFYYY